MLGAHSVHVPVVLSLHTPRHFAFLPLPHCPEPLSFPVTRIRANTHAATCRAPSTPLSAERPHEGASIYDDCGLQMTKLRHTDAETKARGDAGSPRRRLEFRSPRFNPKQHHHACYSFCSTFPEPPSCSSETLGPTEVRATQV